MPIEWLYAMFMAILAVFSFAATISFVLVRSFKQRLQRERKLTSDVLENSPIPTIVCNQEGIIKVYNQQFLDLLNCQGSEIKNRSVFKLDNFDKSFLTLTIQAWRAERKVISGESTIQVDGHTRSIDWQFYAGVEIYPNDKYLVASGRDITELKDAKDALARVEREVVIRSEIAEAKERQKLAELIHDEISQPLTLSLFWLNQIKQNCLPGNEGRLTDLQVLIKRLDTDTRRLTLEIDPTDAFRGGFMPAVEEYARQFSRRYGVKVHVACDALPKPLADKLQYILYRAIRQLLVNAWEHGKAGKIWISAIVSEDLLKISVRDNGGGFQNLTQEKDRLIPRGFGLSNIRDRLFDFGGKLTIDLESNNGALIVIEVPLIRKKAMYEH